MNISLIGSELEYATQPKYTSDDLHTSAFDYVGKALSQIAGSVLSTNSRPALYTPNRTNGLVFYLSSIFNCHIKTLYRWYSSQNEIFFFWKLCLKTACIYMWFETPVTAKTAGSNFKPLLRRCCSKWQSKPRMTNVYVFSFYKFFPGVIFAKILNSCAKAIYLDWKKMSKPLIDLVFSLCDVI